VLILGTYYVNFSYAYNIIDRENAIVK
jgi:hypothetical protein